MKYKIIPISWINRKEGSSKFDIKASQIQEWNEIKDPSKIFPGQVLKLYL